MAMPNTSRIAPLPVAEFTDEEPELGGGRGTPDRKREQAEAHYGWTLYSAERNHASASSITSRLLIVR